MLAEIITADCPIIVALNKKKMKNENKKILEMFKNTRTIAVIGMKDGDAEISFRVPEYLKESGYKIYPVNPGKTGREALGKKFTAKVFEIKDKIDLVEIFRRSEFLVEHAKEILKMKPLPKYVWFQSGIYNDEAAKMLEEKGIGVIQDRGNSGQVHAG
jgi:predicted CoA-binding protein